MNDSNILQSKLTPHHIQLLGINHWCKSLCNRTHALRPPETQQFACFVMTFPETCQLIVLTPVTRQQGKLTCSELNEILKSNLPIQ